MPRIRTPEQKLKRQKALKDRNKGITVDGRTYNGANLRKFHKSVARRSVEIIYASK
jgi:hypothetical protein